MSAPPIATSTDTDTSDPLDGVVVSDRRTPGIRSLLHRGEGLPDTRQVWIVGAMLVVGVALGGLLLFWTPTLPNERERTGAATPTVRPALRTAVAGPAAPASGPSGSTGVAAPTVPPATSPAPATASRRYTIKAGDTLLDIADQFDTTVDAIRAANPGLTPEALRVGQEITIPGNR